MSSDEEDSRPRKRRVQRACDMCRRKKIRCDGTPSNGNQCSNCATCNHKCTYSENLKPHLTKAFVYFTFGLKEAVSAHTFVSYVEGLENRIEELERLLRQPQKKPHAKPNTAALERGPSPDTGASRGETIDADISVLHTTQKWDSVFSETNENLDARSHGDDLEDTMLSCELKQLALDDIDPRFFGKSSGAALVKTAIDLKDEYTGSVTDFSTVVGGQRRPESWLTPAWESSPYQTQRQQYNFPEADLMTVLVDLYFTHVNVMVPILHGPSFRRSIAGNLHLENDLFGAVVLLVCAIASRHSEDTRVLLSPTESWLSSGWKWFRQVEHIRKSIWCPPSLYHLQFYGLSCIFLHGCTDPHAPWTVLGTGIRIAQEMGAHRKRMSASPSVEGELLKRAFWGLVCMDYFVSAKLGRPCAIQDDDFDLEMPIECDDEYWESPDPQQAFRQPPGRPSTVSAFVSFVKLMKITGLVQRTIYSGSRSRMLLGLADHEWEQRMVAELDSALNQWVDSIPDHLRWDPHREDEVFFNQSAVLYAHYYETQIFIHRSFIPTPKRPSPVTFPSLAICTNAARSCTHIVDLQRKRNGFLLAMNQSAIFVSGIMLLLNIWAAKRSGMTIDPNKETAEVHKCMQVLRTCETRWHPCGMSGDVLYELACVGELPLPKGPHAQNKRPRNSDTPSSGSAPDSPESWYDGETSQTRTIAGSRRALASSLHPSPSSSASPSDPQPLRQQLPSLPMYSDELGRLPLHGQLRYSSHKTQTTLNANGGYWFSYPDGATNSGAPLPAAHDFSLPAGYPALSDAEFFHQLSSMNWWSGENTTNLVGGDFVAASAGQGYDAFVEPFSSGNDTTWAVTSSGYR
ncbi:Gypsy retrotransposon integrase-like protein 1 [Paramarasmius palmivorus]|uniref:Gypsy retrotransposon integrase-like protein 1 n=1 Tax=Paramarasmius palmivorus TaxID=297713 RepID=A0AAW0CWP8_9AGAR